MASISDTNELTDSQVYRIILWLVIRGVRVGRMDGLGVLD